MVRFQLGKRGIGDREPTYFIADISANHDGQLQRAKDLIHLAKRAGADAAKFQNFRASQIVSDRGFQQLGSQLSHQAKWRKSVFQVYQDASLPWEWTSELKRTCDEAGIDFFSTPYDFEAVDMLDPFVEFFKIGSGDLTWPEMLEKVAAKGKPVMVATGASTIGEVQRALDAIRPINRDIVLMQCNTNYTGSLDNFRHIQLNVLRAFQAIYPDVVLGLSDHTPGHATVLGAVALGARVVEKHFTDDTRREGPDHPFSMDPQTWRDMVDRTRELELALGNADKRVEGNEQDTVVVQRRCLRAARDLAAGTVVTRADLDVLRPAPAGSIAPYELPSVISRRIRQPLDQGEHLIWAHLE
jgi:N-acetylneuraminate synthase